MGYCLKGAEETFMSSVVVRPRKREAGLLVPAKFTAVARELTVATLLLKILTIHSKICSIYARHQ